MIHIISALVFTVFASVCQATEESGLLADNPPDHYEVVPGDTLWSISARFLREPWRWPELWRMNRKEIRNPNRIYPGDVIVLERDNDGQPYARVQTVKLHPQVRSLDGTQAITAIPANVIEPFISAPLVVDADTFAKAARIVATMQDRYFLGSGDLAYVENAAPTLRNWLIYREGRALFDPDDPKRILGYEALFLGTARQLRAGAPATFEILSVKQEIGRGDRLVPANSPSLTDYVPHKPETKLDGRVVSVHGGVGSAGENSIISLNRGSREGLEVGHILALERKRAVVGRDESGQKFDIPIPHERFGLVFVFRVFPQIAYALVLRSAGTVDVGDFVATP